LGATAFVQLTPNDSEKIIYVRNTLAGSRSIILFQGTYNASNDYEVPAGTTAVIYFDGAGSGAVAANVFNNAYFDSLRLGGVSVTAIIDDDSMGTASATNIATSESIKAYVDAQVGANNELSEVLANGNTTGGTDIAVSTGDDITFADSSKAIFGAGSDLQIYHDGSHSYVSDEGTGSLRLRGVDIQVQNTAGVNAAKFISNADVQLFYAGSQKLATTSTGIDVTGTVTTDGLTADAPLSTLTGLELTYLNATKAVFSLLPSTGEIRIGGTETNYFPTFYSSGTERMRIDSSGNVGIGTSSPSSYGKFVVRGSGNIMNLDATSGPVYAAFKENTTNRFFLATLNGSDGLAFVDADGSSERMRIDSSGNVGIGTSSPQRTLHVHDDSTYIQLTNDTTGTTSSDGFRMGYFTGQTIFTMNQQENDGLAFSTNNTERMRIDSSGNVGIGASSPAAKMTIVEDLSGPLDATAFRLNASSANDSNTLFGGPVSSGNYSFFQSYKEGTSAGVRALALNPSGGNVGIGVSDPDATLDISGGSNKLGILRVTQRASGAAAYGLDVGLDPTLGDPVFSRIVNDTVTEVFRIQRSSGNVGIGTSSPSRPLHVAASDGLLARLQRTDAFTGSWDVRVGTLTTGDFTIYDNENSKRAIQIEKLSGSFTDPALKIDSVGNVKASNSVGVSGSAGMPVLQQAAGSQGFPSYSFYDDGNTGMYRVSSDALGFSTGGAQRLRIDSDGLKFNGDTAAANALDDYEEGTWTPTIKGGAVTGTGTYGVQQGFYRKVGQLVFVSAYMTWTAHTGTGAFVFVLPFTPNAAGFKYSSMTIGYANSVDWGASNTFPNVHIAPNVAEAYLGYSTNNAAWVQSSLDTAGSIIISGCYSAA